MNKNSLKIVSAFCIFFLLSFTIKAQNYEVKGAGKEDVNGIYIPSGKKNGKTQYKNGTYTLFYKGCHSKWMIVSSEGNIYRNAKDSNTPPENGWEKGCGKGSTDPAPTVVFVLDAPKKEN